MLAETKKELQVSQSDANITSRLPLCVEISLQTVDNDRMTLEVWSLNVNTEISDPQIKASYTVYNRMSILLKSLLSITRVTPAYKLSRRQSPESYCIYYKIYSGEPIINLGDSYKQVRIGQISQVGLTMAVAYRTKMTITPSTHENKIMIESNHFNPSPKHPRYQVANRKSDKKVIDLEKPMRCGAFVDRSRIQQYTEKDYNLPENPPFSWLLRKPRLNSEDEDKLSQKSQNDENSSPNNTNLSARIAEAAKLSNSPKDNYSGTSPSSVKSRWSMREYKEDDKLLKELHFPFANPSTPIGDLAKFYRECFKAPPLEAFNTFETDPTFDDVENESAVDELTRQLEEFETSMGNYDDLITSLCVGQESENQNSS